MPLLELQIASPEPDLSVRRFAIREGINTPFSIGVVFRTKSPLLDLEEIVGKPAGFRVVSGYQHVLGTERSWNGICNHIELVQVEPRGLSTYSLSIVPFLWLLTQKTDYRIFQHLSIPDIIDEVLDRWKMKRIWEIDRDHYKKLELRVQYDESDFTFFSRMLEEAGISYVFTHGDEPGSKLLLSDRLTSGAARPPLQFFDHMTEAAEREFITNVRLAHDVRPGKVTLRDYDYRRPQHELYGKAAEGAAEERYEQYHYQPGGFVVEGGSGGGTPTADDKAVARHEDGAGLERARRSLAAKREGSRSVSFETNAIDVAPGRIVSMLNHPHGWLPPGERLLVTNFSISGTHDLEWHMAGRALFASSEYRPPQNTPKPEVLGVQCATVVGPDGHEIHTDEFGRVRLAFHWDRIGRKDDNSSCWVRVSQGWAGKGYGLIALPRVGQEVIVSFLNGNPDQPIVVGRAYTAVTPVPRKLPDHKTESVFRSDSSIGSNGTSEVALDDNKGDELVQWTAHKNMRRLIKNDYASSIGHDRVKNVAFDELDTTGGTRTEVTGKDRFETVNADKITSIKKVRKKLIKGDEAHTTDGHRRLLAEKNVDLTTLKDKRERVVEDVHLVVEGSRAESIDEDQSLIIEEDQFEKVGKNHALATGKELSMRAGGDFINEAGADMTIKSAGGFIRIDALGITISGRIVNINAGGSSPRKGRDPKPGEPEKPKTREPSTAKNQS